MRSSLMLLSSVDVLERNQMKKISGGYGADSGNCSSSRCSTKVRCYLASDWFSDASENGYFVRRPRLIKF